MKKPRGYLPTTLVACLLCSALLVPALSAQRITREQAERRGVDLPMEAPVLIPETVTEGNGPSLQDFLLIPDSTNDRVMRFDPVTGDLVDANFIPADPTNLNTPIQAILSSAGDSILVSDQGNDVVQEYDLQGNYLGVFAPAGGVNTAILDNIRGIALLPNGNLLVTVGSGTNADAIAMFDTSGNSLGNLVTPGTGGLGSPFGILVDAFAEGVGDLIISGIDSDTIHTFDSSTGAHVSDIIAINGFPEQIAPVGPGAPAGAPDGTGVFLVGNFSGTQEGIVEIDFGSVIGVYNPAAVGSNRGVYELPNGNILTTNGGGVHEVDRTGNLVETKISGVSARFITEATALIPVELQSFSVE